MDIPKEFETWSESPEFSMDSQTQTIMQTN